MLFFRSKSQERAGEIIVLVFSLFSGILPVIVHYGVGFLPPIFYASISLLVGALVMLVVLFLSGRGHELKIKEAWLPILLVAFFIYVFPSILFYKGAAQTSGINTGILLTAEVFFALLFSRMWGEKMTGAKIFGGAAMILGTFLVLYNGHFEFRAGEFMIILASAFYPIGTYYGKKVLHKISPVTLVFGRAFLGGLILLPLSLAFEPIGNTPEFLKEFWWLFLINGALIAGLSKLLWYEGLKRLDIGKATILVMTYPAWSMILSTIFLKEIPTLYQFGGLLVIFAGVYGITFYNKKIDFVEPL